MNIPEMGRIEPNWDKINEAMSNLEMKHPNADVLAELQKIRASLWAIAQAYFSDEQKQKFNQLYQSKIAEIEQSHAETD